MRLKLFLLGVALSILAVTAQADDLKPPFTLSVVPSRSSTDERSISTAEKQPRVFYVVLTNVSDHVQSVWEAWNSWGYQNISFEVILSNGKTFPVTKRQHVFTRNLPSVFVIPAGEQQVYPIQLDAAWENCPIVVAPEDAPVTLKAIYSVVPTPESNKHGVWTGRIESASYRVALKQQ